MAYASGFRITPTNMQPGFSAVRADATVPADNRLSAKASYAFCAAWSLSSKAITILGIDGHCGMFGLCAGSFSLVESTHEFFTITHVYNSYI